MDRSYSHVHIDPAKDPPERYPATFELFCELWGRLQRGREAGGGDDFLEALIRHVQNQLIAAAVVLSIKIDADE